MYMYSVSKYKLLEEQFKKESQAKLESTERENTENIYWLNVEADLPKAASMNFWAYQKLIYSEPL